MSFPLMASRPGMSKYNAANNGIIKSGFPGQGYPAWLFVDEVVVE